MTLEKLVIPKQTPEPGGFEIFIDDTSKSFIFYNIAMPYFLMLVVDGYLFSFSDIP